jgi:hypothetical protein
MTVARTIVEKFSALFCCLPASSCFENSAPMFARLNAMGIRLTRISIRVRSP